MSNACNNYARMSTRPPFPPPTHPPFTGNSYPFTPFTPYETHPAQMMPQEASPPFEGHQVPSPVWPNLQYADGSNYQIGGGKYNPQVQGVAGGSNYQIGGGKYNPQVQGVVRIGNGGNFNMGPTMGNNSEFRL